MATDTRNLPAFLADNTTFQTWATGIDTQIKNGGIVQTSDTGQLDVTTASRPGTVSTYAGYRIYRFADTLQGSAPVFIKVEYGVGASATDRPALRVQTGTATDGAGTLSGNTSSLRVVAAAASKTAGVQLASYCSGSTSRLSLASNLDPSTATFSLTVLIERTKSGDGVETSHGIIVGTMANTNAYQVVPFSGTVPTATTTDWPFPKIGSSSGQRDVDGSNVALSPLVAFVGKPLFAYICAYVHANLGELSSTSVEHLGATHTMLPLGDGVNGATSTAGTANSIAMLWE